MDESRVPAARVLIEQARGERDAAGLDRAEALLLEEAEHAPNTDGLWTALGDVELRRWQIASEVGEPYTPFLAPERYGRALEVKPSDLDALRGLAKVHEVLGQYEQALVATERALTLMPDDVGMQVLRGRTLHHLERYEESSRVLEGALVAAEAPGAGHQAHIIRAMLGENLVAMGDVDRAEDLLLDSAQRLEREAGGQERGALPSCPYEALGGLYRATGRDVAAAEMMIKSAALQPASPDAQQRAAEALLEHGDPHGALVYVDRALALHEAERYADLRVRIQRALASAGPSDAPGGLDGAVALFLRGDFLRALRVLDEQESAPGARAMVARGFLLVATERYELARAEFEGALAVPGAQVGLAHLAIVEQDYPAAGDALDVATATEGATPSDGYPWLVQRMRWLAEAWIHGNQGRHAEALDPFGRILAVDPDDHLALLGRGNALNALGQLDQAEAALQRVLEIEPGNRYAMAELALVRFNQGDDQAAERLFQRARELDPTGYTCPYEGLGMVYLRQGRVQEAQASFEQAIAIDPDIEFRKYNGLARIYIEQGRLGDARTLLERSIANHPHDDEAKRLLAQLGETAPERAP